MVWSGGVAGVTSRRRESGVPVARIGAE
jgi:hypothetical protein